MQNYLCHICFDGRFFHGWQVQDNATTVMGTFGDAINKIAKTNVDIKGCSRTDSGVSAKDYCISFKLDSIIPMEGLKKALNSELPDTIAVKSIEYVPIDFHARYNCRGKRYIYTVLNRPEKDPFLNGLCFHYYKKKIDETKLNNIAQAFVGKHDFASFQNAGTEIEDTVREIFDFSVTRDGDLVYFSVSGDGFLYNMVRIMVGTLIEEKENVEEIIEKRDRSFAGFTVPASGLCLDEVFI